MKTLWEDMDNKGSSFVEILSTYLRTHSTVSAALMGGN